MSRTFNETTYVLSGRKLRETDKATHFKIVSINGQSMEELGHVDPKDHVQWFPNSQITQRCTVKPGSTEPDWIRVKEWILKQKELV